MSVTKQLVDLDQEIMCLRGFVTKYRGGYIYISLSLFIRSDTDVRRTRQSVTKLRRVVLSSMESMSHFVAASVTTACRNIRETLADLIAKLEYGNRIVPRCMSLWPCSMHTSIPISPTVTQRPRFLSPRSAEHVSWQRFELCLEPSASPMLRTESAEQLTTNQLRALTDQALIRQCDKRAIERARL